MGPVSFPNDNIAFFDNFAILKKYWFLNNNFLLLGIFFEVQNILSHHHENLLVMGQFFF